MGIRKEDSIASFIKMFTHLTKLHEGHERFALNWLWNDEKALFLFQEYVLGIRHAAKQFLVNGYGHCREEAYDVFPVDVWLKIDELFLNKRSSTALPKPVRTFIKVVRSSSQVELQSLIRARREQMFDQSQHSQNWWRVYPVSGLVLKNMENCFLGQWSIAPQQLFDAELAASCKFFPVECILARTKGNLTYFFERCGDNVNVIAAHMRDALESQAMSYMRPLMEDLFCNHHEISRRSMAMLDSAMTGFGPLWKRYEKGGGMKVSFYTHVNKLSTALHNLSKAKEFEVLADRYAHSHLAEIILSWFIWKLPSLVASFFNISKPFLEKDDYDMTSLETELGGTGPCAYQLYITKDFCSEIHKDCDSSEYTLTYCSHPDGASSTPVQFIIAQHGVRIELGNGSLFGFKSSVAHGTAYRNRTQAAAYMGCLVVTSALHNLSRRRQNRSSASTSGTKRKVPVM